MRANGGPMAREKEIAEGASGRGLATGKRDTTHWPVSL